MLGQDVGFPVPVGEAGELAAALARRAQAVGAQLCTGQRVKHIDVAHGRAVGVRTPFLLVGQMTTADASRSPSGTESAWAYTHLPRGVSDHESADLLVQRVEEVMERFAPGFSARVLQRSVQRPGELQHADANLVHGAVGGGTAQLHQQLVFRPVPGLGRAETPVPGLYLGSAAAHPGGGVHGVCGWLAARAGLAVPKRAPP